MKLNFKEFGSGRPMIILHGMLGSLDNWQSLAKKFSEDFHVFTLDQRNHGQTDHSDDIDYDLMSEDLEEFIMDHQLENPILIGHSMGGKTVMNYTLKNPEKVSTLISVDMSPRNYKTHHVEILKALHSIDFDIVKSRSEAENILMENLGDKGLVLFLAKNIYWKEKNQLAFRFNIDSLESNLDLILSWPHIHGEFTGKSLFIRGSKADYILDEEPNIHAYFPNAEIVDIDSGHWVHAEKPQEFYTRVMDFLAIDN